MSHPRIAYSEEQLAAIRHRDGHLQIIASAGSGKTATISRRCAELIRDGTKPESIIAFTFTEKAAGVLRSRIEQDVSEVMGAEFLGRLSPMYVGTIHAFCLEFLRRNVPEYANFDALDEHTVIAFASRGFDELNLSELGNFSKWTLIRIFLDNVSVVENELLDPESLPDGPFVRSYSRFRELLRTHRLLTFGQMITLVVDAIRKNLNLFAGVEHVIVDEYQDINPAQEQLVRLLSVLPATVTVVGDDLQSIYQWRGSTVENILTFSERYGKVKQKALSTNRRSRPGIILLAEKFSETIKPRLPKAMKPHRERMDPEVISGIAETPNAEAEVVARTVESLIVKGYNYGDVAILLRSARTSSEPFIQAFRNHGVPFKCGGRTGLFLEPEARIFGKTYAWLVDCDWSDAVYGSTPVRYNLDQLADYYRSIFALDEPSSQSLRRFLQEWKSEVSVGSSKDLVRDFYLLLERLKVYEWNPNDLFFNARLGSIARFTQVLVDFESMSRRASISHGNWESSPTGGKAGTWFYRQLYLYMQYYAVEAYEGFPGEERYDLNAVEITTVHQAKGLEWDCVFVSALSDLRFPSRMTGTQRVWLISNDRFDRSRYEGREVDERRLFYVAITRPRDVLYLTSFARINRISKPSRFLSELFDPIPTVDSSFPVPVRKEESGITEERRVLSFSDLSLYEFCPYAFRLRELLGFQPQVISRELGYGRALHHMMRRIGEEAKSTKGPPDTSKAKKILSEEFYLPFATRPTFIRMKEAAQRTVARYLNEYRKELGSVWETERPFWLHLSDVSVSGRADVILGNQEKGMTLVDYKTRTDENDDMPSFQLQIYALAAAEEGLRITSAFIHDLKTGKRIPVDIRPTSVDSSRGRAEEIAGEILDREYAPRPGLQCRKCDVSPVCKAGLDFMHSSKGG